MKKIFSISFLSLVLILFAVQAAKAQDYVPNEVLIKFQKGVSFEVQDIAIQSVQGRVIGLFRLDPDLLHLRVPETIGTDRAISILLSNPVVQYAVRNNIHYINDLFPDDPKFNKQWPLHNTGQDGGTPDADMDAPEAWDLFTGSPNIVVAVLDTGVDYNHEDLAANIWTNPGEIPGNGIDDDGNGYTDDIYGWDFAYDDSDPMDIHGHGTACSGVIGGVGNNGIGVSGINWNVSIMCVKVLDDGGSGTTADIINGIDYATENGAYLTSNSYGCYFCYNDAMRDAIERANAAGKLFTAAAGNYGVSTDIYGHYPSSYDNANIISVTATDRNDNQIYNYGPTTVDMAGYSPEITTTIPGNGYTETFNGTSAACPHVAGVAALTWGYEPGLTHMEVKTRLMETVRLVPSLTGLCVTGGNVNAFNALSAGGPPPEPPAAPTSLTATASACDQIDLTWTDNSDDEDGFKIERSENGVDFNQIDTVGENVTTYSDTGLAEATQYWYRVRAYNAGGDSAYSDIDDATTPPCPAPPNAPSNLTANAVACDQIDLAWIDNSNDEDGFSIERSIDNVNFAEIGTVAPNVTSYSDTTVEGNTTYYYRVRAWNENGYSDYSDTASDTTPECPVPPDAPSDLAANAVACDQIDLTWTDNSNNEDGFRIERSTDNINFSVIDSVGPNVTTYSDTTVSENTTYYYRVIAWNEYGDSAYSNTASDTTPSCGEPPAAPTDLSAKARGKSKVGLKWNDNSNNEDEFIIERRVGTSSTWVYLATVGPNTTSYVDTNVSSKTTYYYRVKARNAYGDSGYSNEASAQTK